MSAKDYLNNLSITATGNIMASASGALLNTLQSVIANGGRDSNCKFYYNLNAGGSVLRVVAKHIVGGLVPQLKEDASNGFNSLLNKKSSRESMSGEVWTEDKNDTQQKEIENYGMMRVNNGKDIVYALDDWGCLSSEAIMLGICTGNNVTISQSWPKFQSNSSYIAGPHNENNGSITTKIKSDTLVWYDTTALVTVNSDKNLVVTRVQGRDYSRKELVSNGDIKFSVTGQISSKKPDVYPTQEVAKFLRIMQHKGVVKVTNQILAQFGITHIVITDFNLSPKEGYKSLQPYTFNALGLMPKKMEAITEDTVSIPEEPHLSTLSTGEEALEEKSQNGWKDLFSKELDRLKSVSQDLADQGLGLATGYLDNLL